MSIEEELLALKRIANFHREEKIPLTEETRLPTYIFGYKGWASKYIWSDNFHWVMSRESIYLIKIMTFCNSCFAANEGCREPKAESPGIRVWIMPEGTINHTIQHWDDISPDERKLIEADGNIWWGS